MRCGARRRSGRSTIFRSAGRKMPPRFIASLAARQASRGPGECLDLASSTPNSPPPSMPRPLKSPPASTMPSSRSTCSRRLRHQHEHERERGHRAPRERESAPASASERSRPTWCQSSNDVIPTTIHVSAALALRQDLLPALEHAAGRSAREGARNRRRGEDRPHAPHGCHADHARAGAFRLARPTQKVAAIGCKPPSRDCWRSRRAARRSARASTRTRNLARCSARSL